MEMRLIIGKLLWHNDVSMLPEDKSWESWDPNQDHKNMRVYTNWIKPPLLVKLSPRRI